MKSSWLLMVLVVLGNPAHADPLKSRATQATVRPYLFVDDSAWEAMPRDRKLPSQSREIDNRIPSDPRDYFLRDTVQATDKGLEPVYRKATEEILTQQFLPAFARLLRSDLGTNESPMSVFQNTLTLAAKQLREKLPEIEAALASPAGPRNIVWLVAPWERAVGDERLRERYAPGQLGFDPRAQTPMRGFTSKLRLLGSDGITSISPGADGAIDFLPRVRELAEKSTAIMYTTDNARVDDPYSERPFAAPPYVYPVAFLIRLRIAPGASSIRAQLLLGLNPMIQKLDPPSVAGGTEINLAGVPQPGELRRSGDKLTHYPMVLVNFSHNLRQELKTVRLGLRFGTFDGYSPHRRELRVSRDNQAWRMAPFLGGTLIKGPVRVPIRVHMTDFDVVADPLKQDATLENLSTAIELFARVGGKITPFPKIADIGIDAETGIAQGAALQVQEAINKQMAQAFADARKKTREQALQKFPLAALFIDGKKQ